MRLNLRFEAEAERAIEAEAKRLRVSQADVVRACVYDVLLGRKKEKIRTTAERLLREGLTNAEVLEGIRAEHGEEASSMDSVAWYRSRLRKVEPAVMTEREARLDRL